MTPCILIRQYSSLSRSKRTNVNVQIIVVCILKNWVMLLVNVQRNVEHMQHMPSLLLIHNQRSQKMSMSSFNRDCKFITTFVLNWHQVQWTFSLFRFQFVITYCLGHQQGKLDALSHHSYFMPKEGHVAYEQQCDVTLKLEHFWLQVLSIIIDDTTLLCQTHENLKTLLLLASKAN
jgi:hypothetical protein